MREFSFNIPLVGLTPEPSSPKGHLALKNLKVRDGYWCVPDAYTMPWSRDCQLLRGKRDTLLWKPGAAPPVGAIGITTIEDLQKIGNDPLFPLSGYYVLLQDIDASATATWNDGKGFEPLGAKHGEGDLFTGVLDGDGYTISGFVINRPDEDYLGLVRHNRGTIKNLILRGSVTGNNLTIGSITAWNGVSGIGSIINCHAYVDVTAVGGAMESQGGIGGMTGRCSGNISYSSAHGDVYAPGCMAVGGFDGVSSHVEGPWYGIEFCHSTGNVTGSLDVGGFAGACANIRNSYATGAVTAELSELGSRGGGFAGACNGILENCYSIGLVTVDEMGTGGGFLGLDSGCTVTACYWDKQASGWNTSAGGTGKTTEEMKLQATFVGWDFASVWNRTDSYPWLRSFFTSLGGFYSVSESTLSVAGIFNVHKTGSWQMADYGRFLVLTDGVSTLKYVDGIMSLMPERLGTVCSRDARMVYGDIDGCQNGVGWSAVDGTGITEILNGTPIAARLAAVNESGFTEMPWRGRVLAIVPMGDKYIVYGEDGVSALQEDGGKLAYVDVGLPADLGLWARAAVAGDDEQHLFRGTDGALWVIQGNLKATRLDFAWTLTTHDTICFDPLENEFWISNATNAYVLTTKGLSGPVEQTPSSMAVIGGEVVATGSGYPEVLQVFAHTNTVDMSMNAQKRITVVNIMGEFADATIGALFRYASNDSFREKAPVRCSPDGAGFLNLSMAYGQLKITATCVPGNRLTRIETRFQAHDRRYVRGTRGFADSPDGNG